MKSLLLTCPSLPWWISSTFFFDWLVASHFFHAPTLFWLLRIDELSFAQILGKEGPKIGNAILPWTCCPLIFLGKAWQENYYDTWGPISVSMSVKVLGLLPFVIIKDTFAQ